MKKSLLQLEIDYQRKQDGLPPIDWEKGTKESWEDEYKRQTKEWEEKRKEKENAAKTKIL